MALLTNAPTTGLDDLEPYRPRNPVDGIDVTAVQARAEHFAVIAEQRFADGLHPAASTAAQLAQAWAAIATAARTGTDR
jgi:hypothetical protein